MKYTSAEAAKILRQLNDDYASVLNIEAESCSFVAAVSEDIETARPEYDFAETQKNLAEIEEKIRKVKHALNLFNTTHTVPGFDMTVDEILVYIPQLTRKKSRLAKMKDRLPKVRQAATFRSNMIEYNYANYDPKAAEEEYIKISETLSKAQLALDTLNSTETMEIDI
ncbi:MAG: hypothetical protein NC253_05050 [Ruminococcus sp.]|nr:hypothetical protein [Ruminococcus sp.]MCM1381588.1 hypothetical protein [Muribaculaceae bacterium]MCM1480268.1 hypothetical protein [Muribaculaceae bacterium]